MPRHGAQPGTPRPPSELGYTSRVKKTGWIALVLGLIVIVIDQLTKQLALAHLEQGTSVPILGDFFSLTLTFNSGAAFSLGSSSTWIFTMIALFVSIALPPYILRTVRPSVALTLGVIWGGAVGNLIDRLFRAPGVGVGHVVDFLNYWGAFVGNVADIALVVGVIVLIILEIAAPKKPTTTASPTPEPEQ